MDVSELRTDLSKLWGLIDQAENFYCFDYEPYGEMGKKIKEANLKLQEFTRLGKKRDTKDKILLNFLKLLREESVHNCPKLISSIGFLVNSEFILESLIVCADYNNYIGRKPRDPLRRHLDSGYTPHLEIIKKLPHHFFDQPEYYAPVEDLLDHLAIRFYAGKVAGDAEDGAIGWIISEILKNRDYGQEDLLGCLEKELKHWTADRLKSCLEVWENKVDPVLSK